MNIKTLFNTCKVNTSSFIGRTGLKIKKYAPEIYFGVGVASFIGTVITASKATLQAEEVVKQHEEDLAQIAAAEKISEEHPDDPDVEYTAEAKKNDTIKVYCRTATKFLKLYGPSIALGALSLTSFFEAYNINKKRYLGAVAAFNAVSTLFDNYRKRVVDEEGESADRHYMYGTEREKIEKTVTDENGKTKKVKEEIEVIDKDKTDIGKFARWFDKDNPNWDHNPDYCRVFLDSMEQHANDLLALKGHLMLNEVYSMLGFAETPEGCVVGWLKDGDGNGYVDFGLYLNQEYQRKAVNGQEPAYLLDFNYDGVIYDKI